MRKSICVVTGTRAEYGLLKPVISRIVADESLDLKLVVTGMHLSPEFGSTYKEIEKDGFPIDEKIEVILSSDTNAAMSKAVGLAIISFSDYFKRIKPDMVVILGDRYEIFAVATAAAIEHLPIAHLCGGDTTEGAIDEFLRHSITKMSYLHFTSTAQYKKRVEQLGESPDRVYNVGATGVENILNVELMDKSDLERSIGFKLDTDFALVTFHPATMEEATAGEQVNELFNALDQFKDIKFIFTKANSDANGRIINQMIDEYVNNNPNTVAFTSLGIVRYLSAMKYAIMVIGNSSSGIYEAPSFRIPTINIGDRQKGRLQGETVINCEANAQEIVDAINLGRSIEFRNSLIDTRSPYEGSNPSQEIVNIIKEYLNNDKIDLKKKFYDLEV